jgi:hypothetical protein
MNKHIKIIDTEVHMILDYTSDIELQINNLTNTCYEIFSVLKFPIESDNGSSRTTDVSIVLIKSQKPKAVKLIKYYYSDFIKTEAENEISDFIENGFRLVSTSVFLQYQARNVDSHIVLVILEKEL